MDVEKQWSKIIQNVEKHVGDAVLKEKLTQKSSCVLSWA